MATTPGPSCTNPVQSGQDKETICLQGPPKMVTILVVHIVQVSQCKRPHSCMFLDSCSRRGGWVWEDTVHVSGDPLVCESRMDGGAHS